MPIEANRRASVEACVLILPRNSSLPTQTTEARGPRPEASVVPWGLGPEACRLLDAKIRVPDLRIVHECLSGPFCNNFTRFQDVGALGDFEGLMGVLFHHQDGHALMMNLPDDR